MFKKIFLRNFILLFTMSVFALSYVRYIWVKAEIEQTDNLLQIASSIEATLPIDHIKLLEAKTDDIKKPDYKKIKEILMAVIRVNPHARFAYLYAEKNDTIRFLADSEPESSADYSPPGQIYDEAKAEDLQPFRDGKSRVTDPLTDRWGTWRSAFVPIKDQLTGQVIAVFGMDFNAETWNKQMAFKVIQSSLVLILLMTVIFIFFLRNKYLNHDIIIRKKSGEVLELTKQSYLDIINTVSEAIYILDPSGVFIDVNKGAEKMYLSDKDYLVGKTPADISAIGLNDLDKIQTQMQSVFQTGISASFEFWAIRKNGEIFPKEVIVNKGRYFGKDVLVATARDITERKEAEKEMIKLRKAINGSTEALFMTDKEGIITFINPGFTNIYGHTADEIIGRHTPRILKSGVMPEELYANFWKTIMSGQEIKGELRNKRKDGAIIDVEGSANAIFDDKKEIIGFLGIQRDITKRKKVEYELLENDKFLKETQLIGNLGTFTVDFESAKWINSEVLNLIFGITHEFVDPLEDWLSIVHPQWREPMKNYLIHDVIGKNATFDKEYKIIRQNDHEERWVHGLATIKYNDYNQPISMVGTIHDITERKLSEIELINAKEKAEESDRLKSAFLANMSHEIRTPMNGILGFAELLKEPELSGDQQKEYVEIIEKSGARMLNIINDIIDISKIESGQMKVTITDTNINAQFDFITAFFKPEAEQKNIQLICKNSLSDQEALVKTDKEKVYAILTNLIKNALKFTNKGFVEFGCNLETRHDEKTRHTLSLLKFYIKDTGIGISDEKKEIIFERFRQENESLTRNYEGAGLGLAISKAYVEMLGGTIWMESEPGKGSSFYFTIPVSGQSNEKVRHKHEPISEAVLKKKDKLKILIAEDDEGSEKLLTIALNVLSNDILIARNGLEAIEICRNNPDLDFILMDIQMPQMNGYKATQEIRKFNTKVLIIAQTAFALSGDREKAIDAGCDDYITKPIRRDNLIALIKSHIKK